MSEPEGRRRRGDHSVDSQELSKLCGSCSGQIVSARVPAYDNHCFSAASERNESKPAGDLPSDMTIDSRKLIRFAKALRGRRIGVVGDFMLDRYVSGSATRLSPEAPVPVIHFMNE